MSNTKIEPYRPIIPMIYAYTTPEIKRHQGWTKIGYTDKQTVKARINEQVHTADVEIMQFTRMAQANPLLITIFTAI